MLFLKTILCFFNAFKISLKNLENCQVYYVLEFELWMQIAKNDTKTINDETCIITGAKMQTLPWATTKQHKVFPKTSIIISNDNVLVDIDLRIVLIDGFYQYKDIVTTCTCTWLRTACPHKRENGERKK